MVHECKEKKKNYVGSQTTTYINKGKRNTLAYRAVCLTREKEVLLPSVVELLRNWRLTSRPLHQTKILRATGFFKSASKCCQFVCINP